MTNVARRSAHPRRPCQGTRNDSSIPVIDRPVAENLEGERKTVTVLFADIKGSMDLIEDLDPEEARKIVEPALKLMMEAVQHSYQCNAIAYPAVLSRPVVT